MKKLRIVVLMCTYCAAALYACPGYAADYIHVNMSVVNYSQAAIDLSASTEAGGPQLFTYSAAFSAFNPMVEEALIGKVANPNRYASENWECVYTMTAYNDNGEIALGSFKINYHTDAERNAEVRLLENNLLSNGVIGIDGDVYDFRASVHAEHIMVMIIPTIEEVTVGDLWGTDLKKKKKKKKKCKGEGCYN